MLHPFLVFIVRRFTGHLTGNRFGAGAELIQPADFNCPCTALQIPHWAYRIIDTMLIFLDYDGVLHDYGSTTQDLFRHALKFAAVLRDHANVEVVVSSDWRKDAGSLAELVTHFEVDVRHRFVGRTGIDSGVTQLRRRERECWQWLCAHGREHERWIAIDDSPDNFGQDLPGAGAVLFTDPGVGLDDDATVILHAMLVEPRPATRFCYDRASLHGWTLWCG